MSEKETLLELLRAAIWDREPVIEEADWDRTAKLAEKMSVLPLVADRILKLDPESLSDGTRKDLMAMLRKAVYLNGVMQSVIVDVFGKMENAGMNPVLLKGFYNATAYPEPYLRLSSDIDIFVGAERFEEAVRLAFGPDRKTVSDEKHVKGRNNGIKIELHKVSFIMKESRAARIYGGYEKEFLKSGYGSISIMGHGIAVPDPTFHVFYLACHTWGHLLSGISIRQFCDLSLFLDRYIDRIDTQRLERMLQSVGLMSQWRTFMAVCTDILGLDPAKAPFLKRLPKWRARYLTSVTFSDADWIYSGEAPAEKIWILRKVHAWLIYTGRHAKAFALFPASVFRAYCFLLSDRFSRYR